MEVAHESGGGEGLNKNLPLYQMGRGVVVAHARSRRLSRGP